MTLWGVQSAQKTRPQYLDKGWAGQVRGGGRRGALHLQWCLRLNMEKDAAHCAKVTTTEETKGVLCCDDDRGKKRENKGAGGKPASTL